MWWGIAEFDGSPHNGDNRRVQENVMFYFKPLDFKSSDSNPCFLNPSVSNLFPSVPLRSVRQYSVGQYTACGLFLLLLCIDSWCGIATLQAEDTLQAEESPTP